MSSPSWPLGGPSTAWRGQCSAWGELKVHAQGKDVQDLFAQRTAIPNLCICQANRCLPRACWELEAFPSMSQQKQGVSTRVLGGTGTAATRGLTARWDIPNKLPSTQRGSSINHPKCFTSFHLVPNKKLKSFLAVKKWGAIEMSHVNHFV